MKVVVASTRKHNNDDLTVNMSEPEVVVLLEPESVDVASSLELLLGSSPAEFFELELDGKLW